MQQIQLCLCGGILKVVLAKHTLRMKCEKCGRMKRPERPRPLRRPA